LAINLAACSARPNVFSEPRDERLRRFDRERAQLQRTTDPVGRTKIHIRLSELRISFVGDAVDIGDFEMMEEHLEGYRTTIKDARDTMMNSGRDASRRSGGFRELEIALRQHMRQLDDIGGRLTFQYRDPVEEVITEVSEIRDELLRALFPDGNATSSSH
jgi:putative component of toxin-antitoxin plasmid stabilization module